MTSGPSTSGEPSRGNELLRFGRNVDTPVVDDALRSRHDAKDSYHRIPTQFMTPSLRNGASDDFDTGYAPTKLPDDERTALFLQQNARKIKARKYPNMTALPSTERYHTDIADPFFAQVNKRSERLQSLLRKNTNMSLPTAPVDNYAVQSRDLVTQVQRVAAEANQWLLQVTPAVLDATARQYELELATATATEFNDSEALQRATTSHSRTSMLLTDATKTSQSLRSTVTNLTRNLRLEKDTTSRLQTEIARLKAIKLASRNEIADLLAQLDVPARLVVQHTREQLARHLDQDQLEQLDPLLSELSTRVDAFTRPTTS